MSVYRLNGTGVVAEGAVDLGGAVGGIGAEPELDGLARGVVGLGIDGFPGEQSEHCDVLRTLGTFSIKRAQCKLA